MWKCRKQFQTEHWLCENRTNDCSTSSFPRGPYWYQHRPPASPHLALSMCYKYIPRWGTSSFNCVCPHSSHVSGCIYVCARGLRGSVVQRGPCRQADRRCRDWMSTDLSIMTSPRRLSNSREGLLEEHFVLGFGAIFQSDCLRAAFQCNTKSY